ncbi:ABC transporter ATP-binding protein [Phenylobacterium immobile]|uniref:ABC transporter ATP-binding protein n=1 Tax=Phenylobacterium immobile TaxID=21 RepID=UPI000A8D0A03|nr:ABC transporter ATP-binding protein [Phenylobacterium immobile]
MSDAIDEDDRPRSLSNLQVLRFIAGFWMRRPWLFWISIVLTVVSIGFDLAVPWAAGRLMDAVSAGPGAAGLAWSAWLAYVGVFLAFQLIRNLSFRSWNPLAARSMKELTDEGFARVQSFSSDWHANTFAGATVRRLSRAMWGYDQVSDAVVLWLGSALLVLIGMTVMMTLRWPLVGLFSGATVILYVASNLYLAKVYVRPANLQSVALDSAIGGALADAISANATVKAFGAEPGEERRIAAITADWRLHTLRTWNRFIDVWLLQNLILVGLQAGLSGLLLRLWARGEASAGDVTFAITAFMLMSGYLRNIGENVRQMQKGLDDAQDAAAYARTAPEVADAEGAPAFQAGSGMVVFDRVTFGYKAAGTPLYEDFSLVIAPGERVALVGPTGAGKSTFVKLIQRLYDLDSGRILIDGQDVAHVEQRSLRRAIALVPQDPALFHRTIAENIRYARPDASDEAVRDAARRARADGFIARLPAGYDTLVGERGVKLSGGERQRVAIARAILADAPILVLDEATSSLDVETERQVQDAMDELMAGRTTIVIAHRLSTIRGADRILVFDQGRVVEDGRHAELVAKRGAYARLNALATG